MKSLDYASPQVIVGTPGKLYACFQRFDFFFFIFIFFF